MTIGADITIDELREAVDAVIYAYGAGSDKRLGIPGEELTGSIAAPSSWPGTAGIPTSTLTPTDCRRRDGG